MEILQFSVFLIYINHGQTKKKETRIKMFVHTMVFDIRIVFCFYLIYKFIDKNDEIFEEK